MDQGRVSYPPIVIKLATIGRVSVTLANRAMANIGKKRKMSVYIRSIRIRVKKIKMKTLSQIFRAATENCFSKADSISNS